MIPKMILHTLAAAAVIAGLAGALQATTTPAAGEIQLAERADAAAGHDLDHEDNSHDH